MKHRADDCPGPGKCAVCAPLVAAKAAWKPLPESIEKTMTKLDGDEQMQR